jgi:hypothetical protein
MSDYGVDFGGLSEDELIAMLSQMGGYGGMPGKTPANQLNYYQDMVSSLGFDPIQAMGTVDPEADAPPEYVPSISKQRRVYGGNSTYVKMFDAIDANADPTSAVAAAGIKDPDEQKKAEAIAAAYAGEIVDEENSRQKFEQSNQKKAASYTAPDGSKYKNAPLGGPSSDIMASASEYDLMGAPDTQQLLEQLVQQKALKRSGSLIDLGPQSRSTPATYTTPGVRAGQSVTRQMGSTVDEAPPGVSSMEMEYAKSMQKNSPTYTTKATKAVQPTSNSGNGPERSWEEPSLKQGKQYIGGSVERQAALRQNARGRIDKAKSTQVRSDANTNAMRRILTLRTIIGG